ncbi:MAG: alpha/beta hydrolase [Anaerolineaceae bacterium]|nr:alpha/beta hydrolase [Anaerolineaceae bacterium]
MSNTPSTTPTAVMTEIQGIRTSFLVAGEGDPVLLLHGWGATSVLVWPLAEKLAGRGFRVYVPDLPGFGKTEAPPIAWSVFDYANFVLAFMDAQDIQQAHFFGHSFGGRLGLILGAEHPERFQKMALADSAGVRPIPSKTSQFRLKTYKSIRNGLQAMGMTALAELLRRWYNRRYGSADFQAVSGVMRETFVNVVNQDLLAYAARVQPPTLLLWGEKDVDTPLSQAKLLEKTIPDAGLVVFDGAGHYSYIERLADTARILDHFFRQA